jgi:hypothetical protein
VLESRPQFQIVLRERHSILGDPDPLAIRDVRADLGFDAGWFFDVHWLVGC